MPKEKLSPEKLLAEIKKTDLGVYLIDHLHMLDVEINIVDGMGNCGGLFDPFNRVIKIDSSLSLAEALHTFAHETRHAAQMLHHRRDGDIQSRLGGIKRSFNITSNPHCFAMHMLMAEIDADVFAVYFLHDHRQKTGSTHFDAMREPPFFNIVERRNLYGAFDHAWAQTGHSSFKTDIGNVLRFVAATWVYYESELIRFYTKQSVQGWRKGVVPLLKTLEADEAKMLQEAVQIEPAQTIAPLAVTYARIFHEAGFPAYMKRSHQQEYTDMLVGKSARNRGVVRALARYQKLAAR